MVVLGSFLVLCFLVFAEDVGGEDEVVEALVVAVHDVGTRALPFGTSLTDEDNLVANAHH